MMIAQTGKKCKNIFVNTPIMLATIRFSIEVNPLKLDQIRPLIVYSEMLS